VIAGAPVRIAEAELEELVVSRVAARPRANAWLSIPNRPAEGRAPVSFAGTACVLEAEAGGAPGTLWRGASGERGFVWLELDGGRLRWRGSVAEHVVSAFALADRLFDTGIGALRAIAVSGSA